MPPPTSSFPQSNALSEADENRHAIKKRGHLIAVVGPSGAGKDAIISAALRQRPDLACARRVITRAAVSGDEEHEAIDEAEFARREAAGDFVLTWKAHGLSYGIPHAALASLEPGRTLLFNGSRAALAPARAQYPDLAIIMITASRATRAQRLAARNRESAEAIEQRLARVVTQVPEKAHIVDNDGDLAHGVANFLAALDAVKGDNAPSPD